MESDPAGKLHGMAVAAVTGTVREPFPLESRVTPPKLNRPSRLALTVPVGTDPPAVAGATAIVKVTGSANMEGLTLDVTVSPTEPLGVPTTTGEVLPL